MGAHPGFWFWLHESGLRFLPETGTNFSHEFCAEIAPNFQPRGKIHTNLGFFWSVVSLGAQPWSASLLLDANFFYADQ